MTVPVGVTAGIFKHFNQLIRDFLWNGNNNNTLNLGGLGLLNVDLYGISFEMIKLAKHWINGSTNQFALMQIENELAAPSGPTEALTQKMYQALTTTQSWSIPERHE